METRKKAAQLLTAMQGILCGKSALLCDLLSERLSWPKRLRICFQIRKKKNGGSHKRATVVFVIGEAGAAVG